MVTAWFALTPSGPENGCLRFLPGLHTRQLPHEDTYAPGNLLLKGQTIRVGARWAGSGLRSSSLVAAALDMER